MSLDAEWDVRKSLTGMIMGQGSISVIQLSYIMEPEEKVHALVIQLLGRKFLSHIIDQLKDCDITFIGPAIRDMKKITRDFGLRDVQLSTNIVDISLMARKHNIIKNGNVSLEQLVEVPLHEKSSSVQLSKWSDKKLSNNQIIYAALDVIKAHKVYLHLNQLPDLTTCMSSTDATVGRIVGIGNICSCCNNRIATSVDSTNGLPPNKGA
jgi:ribonuclease D